jgi:mannosyltransferase OCH1-like enzyme
MIPTVLIRTVPAETSPEVEGYWSGAQALHAGWSFVTYRDPLDPALFPLTSPFWGRCGSGAQLAGLVRLEALWRLGGIYLDSDVQVFRSLDPLRSLGCFAAWEDDDTLPDAVLGATPHHPAIRACIDLALERIQSTSTDWRTGNGAWSTGPGVTTTVLPFFDGVTCLGRESFYGVHYTEKHRLSDFDPDAHPEAYGLHQWHGSWLPEA